MKKRIAIVHTAMVVGGVEKALVNLLHYIDYSQYEVTLWLMENAGPMLAQIDPRVEIRTYDRLGSKNRFFLKEIFHNRNWSMLLTGVFYCVLLKIGELYTEKAYLYKMKSRHFQIDEVYDAAICYQSLPYDCPRLALYGIKAPVKLAWLHGNYAQVPEKRELEHTEALYRDFDRIVCVSDGVRKIHEGYFPQLRDKFCVIYNLQNIQAIHYLAQETPDDPFIGLTLVSVGRLTSEKGHDMIPEIARNLLDLGHDIKWYVVGEGPTRELIEERIRFYHVENTVILTGEKENPYPYIKNASLYVQPSYQEGFCVTTFEAKILQTPVVVTDVPGMREQFTEETAYFAEPTVSSLTDAISKALKTPPLSCEPVTEEFNRKEIQKLYRLIDDPKALE